MFDKSILDYHAVLIIGGTDETLQKVRGEISKLGKSERFFDLNTFGINESHELSALAVAQDKPSAFIVKAFSITNEAQNALLKLTEEPSKNFQIIIFLPTDQAVLATFKSRFRVLAISNEKSLSAIDVKDFISASVPKRLALLAPYLEHPEGEEETKIKKEFFLAFIHDLHKELAKLKNTEGLAALGEVDGYGGMTAPSYRMFFEYLATTIPVAPLKK